MAGVRMWIASIALLIIAAWSPPASAQGSRDRARMLGERGIEHYEAGRYDQAFEAFEAANAEFPAPTFALFMARCRGRQQRLLEARELYRGVEQSPRTPDEPEQFARARADAKRELLALQVRIPTLRIDARGQRLEHVRLNGKPHDPKALVAGLEINPGSYELRARVAGRDVVEHVQIVEGARRVLELSPRETPPVRSRAVKARSVSDAPSDQSIAPWIAFGVGAAGLIVGSVAGVIALGQANDVKADCENAICPIEREQDGTRAERTALISTIGFAVAGVGAATGVVLLLAAPGSADPAAASIGVRGQF